MNSKKSPTNFQRMCIPLKRLDSSGSRFKFPILGHCCRKGGGGGKASKLSAYEFVVHWPYPAFEVFLNALGFPQNLTWQQWTKSHLVNLQLLKSNLFHFFIYLCIIKFFC